MCSYVQKFTQCRICKKSHKRIFAKFAIFVKIDFFQGTFAISFVLKIILCRILPIFAIFVKLAIIVKIATLDGTPLPYHLTCSYYYGEFRHFHSFCQICHFRQNRQSQRGPLIIFNFTCSKGFGKFSSYSPFRQNRLFPTFLIAGVWISLYSCISTKLIQVY